MYLEVGQVSAHENHARRMRVDDTSERDGLCAMWEIIEKGEVVVVGKGRDTIRMILL